MPEEQSAEVITPGGGLPASAGQAGSGSGEPETAQAGRSGHASPLRNGPPPLGLEDVSFLTVAEVAGVMRVSKMTVYRMVHSGELAAVRVGRSFRVPAKAVRDYLSSAYVETE
ncbi:MAG TPA: helix-turn-helix domain-containing protein [Actinocrinis sp.]